MLDAFVELDADGGRRTATAAPYLDCRPATTEEIAIVGDVAKADWLTGDLGQAALEVAITQAMPGHLAEVRARTEERVTKTKAAVHQRLTRDQLLGPPGVSSCASRCKPAASRA